MYLGTLLLMSRGPVIPDLYHDILAQFITMHNKKSNVLLIWSGDWPTYSSNSDKYYVILAGEGFDSTDEAWNWCKANNYGPNDCMPIDLQ